MKPRWVNTLAKLGQVHTVLVVVLGLFMVFVTAGGAFATPDQSRVAASCTPDDDAIPEKYSLSSGKIYFQGTSTGSLYFYCHFTNPEDSGNPDWNALFLTNKDTGANGLVEAKLYRKARSNGATYLVTTLTSTDNANIKEEWKLLPVALNFNENAYWVQVRLNRTLTTATPEFHSVTLGYLLY